MSASIRCSECDLPLPEQEPREECPRCGAGERTTVVFVTEKTTVSDAVKASIPGITTKALLQVSEQGGLLVQAVGISWFEIIQLVQRDPRLAHELGPRKWEEIIAGAYERAGFDEVILTPRSADKGRDVIATKRGLGSIRFFDQVKAYRPDRVVSADEVRAVLGVITGAQNVSKGVITTTARFAPRLLEDEYIRPHVPFRLELKDRDSLFSWLDGLIRRPSDVESL